MGIHDLDEELHQRDGEAREAHPESKFTPNRASLGVETQLSERSERRTVRTNFFREHAKAIRWGMFAVGGVAFFMLFVGTFVRIQQSLFSESRVTVAISGPENVNSSDLTTFVITYGNANRSGLSGAELVVSYPPSFTPEGNEGVFRNDVSSSVVSIGNISAFGTGSFNFSGKFHGSKNSVAYIRAELRYKPNNLQSQFSATGQKSVNIRTASLAIEIEAPLTVPPSGETNYLVNYENTSDAPLSNVRLKATYPLGFSFGSADPKPSEEETVWYIGNIASQEKGKIRITGSLDGVPNEAKVLKIELGTFQGDNTFLSYSDAERTTRVVAPPFDIRQYVNGAAPKAVSPGDVLRYAVSYRNDSAIALREAIVTVELVGSALDFSRLRSDGGAYDSARSVITWKASDIPALANLAPHASGTVSFNVPVQSDFVPENSTSTNFQIKTTARIESPDVPNPAGANKIVSTNTMWVKVNSRLLVESQGAYKDGNIPNTGPIPPVVGQETTYTLHWLLSNTTNDVTGVEVSADLPTGALWMGKTFPSSETVSYNERTNRIVWNVGSLGVGVGTLSPKREVFFQVSIRPEMNEIDQNAPLLGITSAQATDVFTNEAIQSQAREKTTSLPEDTSLSPSIGYKVVGR